MLDMRLSTLTVVKKADNVGRDEPMLWTMFIVISLETINSRQFVITTDPIAGKLAKAGKGDQVSIPASAGHFRTDSGGIGLAGLAVIGFDNDLRTKNQIKAGYEAGAKEINQAILDHFPKFGFAPVEEEEMEQIRARVRAAIKNAFVEKSAILTLFGGKPLGGESLTRTLTGVDNLDESFSLTLRAKKDRAIYRVDGRFQFQG